MAGPTAWRSERPRLLPGPSLLAAGLGVLGLLLSPAVAAAASCCAGASTSPGRLMLHERALVGAGLQLASELGAHDSSRRYASTSGQELGAEQAIFGTLRVLERGQLSLRLPLVQTYREASGLSEWGGGFGDASLSGRWDLVFAGESLRLPGIAFLADWIAPTGRAPEAIEQLLGTDATGTGASQLMAGLQVEQLFGPWLVHFSTSLGQRLAREVRGADVPASALLRVSGGLALSMSGERAVGAGASFLREGRGDREHLRLAISGATPIDNEWRVQATLFSDPPFGGWGRNQGARFGGTFLLIRGWS